MSKYLEQKAIDVAHGTEQKQRSTKPSYFGDKKLKGKIVQVKDGDTLWGIARKFNVCSLLYLSFRKDLLLLWWLHSTIRIFQLMCIECVLVYLCIQVSVDALMKHNGIKDGDNISAGETIIVPRKDHHAEIKQLIE